MNLTVNLSWLGAYLSLSLCQYLNCLHIQDIGGRFDMVQLLTICLCNDELGNEGVLAPFSFFVCVNTLSWEATSQELDLIQQLSLSIMTINCCLHSTHYYILLSQRMRFDSTTFRIYLFQKTTSSLMQLLHTFCTYFVIRSPQWVNWSTKYLYYVLKQNFQKNGDI